MIMKAKFLFVGGAPRSGTTLLDDHPELVTFPAEHSTFEQYFNHQHDKQSYFKERFISDRREGHQTILANEDLMEKYLQKLHAEYDKQHSLQIDTAKFKESYLQNIRSSEDITLSRVLTALADALSSGSSYVESKSSHTKYYVFKQPYYTDYFAAQIIKLIPDAKFIYISRDPIARYTSAKQRRIIGANQSHKRLGPINKVNFVEGHTEIDATAKELSLNNQSIIGEGRYKIVQYEDMLNDSDVFFKDLFIWLGITESLCYKKATLLGKPVVAGSSMVTKEGIDKSAVDRNQHYFKLTTWNERIVHQYYLHLMGYSSGTSSMGVVLIAYLLPFKEESFKHFVFKYIKVFRLLRSKKKQIKDLSTRLFNRIKINKATISGAT